ncbi:hypothetical protein CEXT_294851 [Caerostris extrusa]|uniref:Uncharacterized protein n=1 Tax=Caerostris extrusa TaxID=172846 RepID=A0AAV4PCH4_CAEEX|nr:hypothetical protein CEXT_294851 [Caerostris extrusa]
MERAQNGGPDMNAWHEGGGTTGQTFHCSMGFVDFKLGFWLVCSLAKAVRHRGQPCCYLELIEKFIRSSIYGSCLMCVCLLQKEWIKFLVGYLIFFRLHKRLISVINW